MKAKLILIALNTILGYVATSLASVAYGQTSPRDATVLITEKHGDKTSQCSGINVDPSGWVLSAEHCEHRNPTIRFSDGTTVKAELAFDGGPGFEGVVAYRLPPGQYPFVMLADRVPQPREAVFSFGYANGFRRASGTMIRGIDRTYRGTKYKGNLVTFNGAPGWSGGPLFDASGRLCGIMQGGHKAGLGPTQAVFLSYAATKAAYQARSARVCYVFTQEKCPPCKAFEKDLKAGHFRSTGVRFVIVKHGTNEWNSLAPEFNRTVGNEATKGIPTPTFWVRGTTKYSEGYRGPGGLIGCLKKFFDGLRDFLIGRPRISPPIPSTPVEAVQALPADVKQAIADVKAFKEAGVIGKLKLIPQLKADKERLETEIKLLVSEKDNLKTEVGQLQLDLLERVKEHKGEISDVRQKWKDVLAEQSKVAQVVKGVEAAAATKGELDKLNSARQSLHERVKSFDEYRQKGGLLTALLGVMGIAGGRVLRKKITDGSGVHAA